MKRKVALKAALCGGVLRKNLCTGDGAASNFAL